MFKTKRYYKNCLEMQIKNNKMINEKLILERDYSKNKALEMVEQELMFKKQISGLKGQLTKAKNKLNQIKKMKEEQ